MTAIPLRLPPQAVERMRQLAAAQGPPAPLRDAATVLLLRDGAAGIEVYLLRRVAGMAFGGMHVFPGGSVDPEDSRSDIGWTSPPAAAWTEPLEAPEPLARALVCAAVRETFEEAHVLLAGRDEDDIVDVSGPGWEEARRALERRELSLSDLLARESLVLRADLLAPWAHWITPVVEPKRFDTRFFVAALPAGQSAQDVGGEADQRTWLPVAGAADRYAAGELAMMPPTASCINEVAAFGSVAEVMAAARQRVVTTVRPRFVMEGDNPRLLYPWDEEYDA